MSGGANYKPGGDAQAIARIAKEYYGSYRNMFEIHGWPERGNQMMIAQQSRVGPHRPCDGALIRRRAGIERSAGREESCSETIATPDAGVGGRVRADRTSRGS